MSRRYEVYRRGEGGYEAVHPSLLHR
jgi:hypothetical protein